MATRTAIYAGSFDPLTNGHLDVLKGALAIADTVYRGDRHPSGQGSRCSPSRSASALIENAARARTRPDGQAASRSSPLTGWSSTRRAKHGASILIRGLRDGTDLDYEMQMAGMNETMAPDLQTVFLPASPSVRTITATLVRQIASMGGDIRPFVPRRGRRTALEAANSRT